MIISAVTRSRMRAGSTYRAADSPGLILQTRARTRYLGRSILRRLLRPSRWFGQISLSRPTAATKTWVSTWSTQATYSACDLASAYR